MGHCDFCPYIRTYPWKPLAGHPCIHHRSHSRICILQDWLTEAHNADALRKQYLVSDRKQDTCFRGRRVLRRSHEPMGLCACRACFCSGSGQRPCNHEVYPFERRQSWRMRRYRFKLLSISSACFRLSILPTSSILRSSDKAPYIGAFFIAQR